ncbi:MAG: hypothetical protein MK171_10875 [Pirellulales bacterium]|nr:hypothetical protein [Pirellulales bacterium]
MKRRLIRLMLVALVASTTTALFAERATAECATCPAPAVGYHTVAYQPAQPVVAYRPYTGWYLGKLLDHWRARGLTRRIDRAVSPTTYAASYPPYTTAYAPYTAGCASYSVGYARRLPAYAPYLTSYAPLTSPGNTCAQTVTRPVVLSPVIVGNCLTCSCDPCGCASSCAGVSQAVYGAPPCTSCAAGATTYSSPSTPSSIPNTPSLPSTGPPTGQPELNDQHSLLENETFRTNRPTTINGNHGDGTGSAGSKSDHPGSVDDSDSSTFFDLKAPNLFDPSDQTAAQPSDAHGPTVHVWSAVYRKPVTDSSQGATKLVSENRSQAEIDAEGWSEVRSEP